VLCGAYKQFLLTGKGRGNYRKAMLACRKHRIDLNVIVDHDSKAFLARIDSFVEQVHEVDYINIFLSAIGFVAS
jgi:elongator complex protein 1